VRTPGQVVRKMEAAGRKMKIAYYTPSEVNLLREILKNNVKAPSARELLLRRRDMDNLDILARIKSGLPFYICVAKHYFYDSGFA